MKITFGFVWSVLAFLFKHKVKNKTTLQNNYKKYTQCLNLDDIDFPVNIQI